MFHKMIKKDVQKSFNDYLFCITIYTHKYFIPLSKLHFLLTRNISRIFDTFQFFKIFIKKNTVLQIYFLLNQNIKYIEVWKTI